MLSILCRSQDKGFHVENALLHVFTRSLPYTTPQVLMVEETVEEDKVKYNVPTELSDYIFRYSSFKSLMLFSDNSQKSYMTIYLMSLLFSSGGFSALGLLILSSWYKIFFSKDWQRTGWSP